MEGTKNGHLASSKWVAGDQGRGGAGDSGHGNKWIHLRHNQGAKPTGQGDGFNGGGRGREREGVIAGYQISLSSNWMAVVPPEMGYTGRGPGGAQQS